MLILVFIGGMSPIDFIRKTRDVLLLAFFTSSSVAVMPLSINAARKLVVRTSVAQFSIPMGTTINVDATALYQMMAALFLATSFGADHDWQGALVVMVMVLGASIGSPGTPDVDRILDMCSTTINVSGYLAADMVALSPN